MSRLPGVDPGAVEATLDQVDDSGGIHVVCDDAEPPLTIEHGLADGTNANTIPNRLATGFAAASVKELVTTSGSGVVTRGTDALLAAG